LNTQASKARLSQFALSQLRISLCPIFEEDIFVFPILRERKIKHLRLWKQLKIMIVGGFSELRFANSQKYQAHQLHIG